MKRLIRRIGKYFIEVIGLPNSGKHTYIKEVIRASFDPKYKRRYEGRIESIYADQNIPSGIINPFEREMRVLSGVLNQIINAHILRADIFCIHRAFYDALAWFKALAMADLILKEKEEEGIIQAKKNLYRVDLVVLIEVPVEVSLKRAKGVGIKDTLTGNKAFLEALFLSYEEIKKELTEGYFILDGIVPEEEISKNVDILMAKILPLLNGSNPSIPKSELILIS